MDKLSDTMLDCINSLKKETCLFHERGGFWSAVGVSFKTDIHGYDVPEWYFGTRTILALEKRKIVKVERIQGDYLYAKLLSQED